MKPLRIILALCAAITISACNGESAGSNEFVTAEPVSAPGTIVDIVSNDASFSTLVGSIEAAGLADELGREGPLTIFAPTDAAFAKLDAARLADLAQGDGEELANVLNQHVVEGAVDAETLISAIEEAGEDGYSVPTLGTGTLTASRNEGAIVLTDEAGNQALIEATDVEASNGLIHVIDTVLMPG